MEKYIETQNPGAGGQYWPIVKHVRLRMPNCDVCSSGAALVDLPGVRDSNAARDKIAKEYLKNCTAVWVVSSIHRAIDDKTAKELLGENFRRQLLMDGQYGSIAFICTKTDIIMPSEIIRQLELEGETKEHEDLVSEMESEKIELDLTASGATKKLCTLTKSEKSLKKEAQELRDSLTELGNLLDPVDADNSQSEENEAIDEYKQELTRKEEELTEAGNQIEQLQNEKQEATQKTLELEKQLNVRRKAIAAICARARNEYSKTQIKRDFKAGLKEMKRRAGMMNIDGADEEDIYSDDDVADDDVGSNAENLKVFCCSSTEYQKMKNLLMDDGPPQVFSSLDDTQIPSLRHYVHEMTSIRRKQSMERLMHNLGRFVFDLQMYICEGRDMKTGNRRYAKSAVDAEVQKFGASLSLVVQQLKCDINAMFNGIIRQKMEEGSSNASSEANNTCAKWSAPVNRDPNKDNQSGGLHWCTYKATVRRQGVCTSHSYGPVDFNEDLAEPMYRSMTIVWDRVFSGMLWKVLDKLKVQFLGKLKEFTAQLVSQLELLGIPPDRTQRVSILLHGSASNKLTEMVAHLKEMITSKQRDISRVITPHIQSTLLPEYTTCAAECGLGMYMRLKMCMSQGIDSKRTSMFGEATESMVLNLMHLQNEVVQYVCLACQTLMQDLRTAFEPLWEAPANSLVIRSAFQTPIQEVCASMHKIYDEAGLSHTEEHGLVPATSTTPGVTATDSAYPGVADELASSSADGWRSHEQTFLKQEDTPYGSMEQCRQLGVRVKTERLSENCVSETTETVQILHTKQEKLDTDCGNN